MFLRNLPITAKYLVCGAVAALLVLPLLFVRHAPPSATKKPSPAVHTAQIKIVRPKRAAIPAPSAFAKEQQMSFAQLMNRWNPDIAEASKRFGVPQNWIRAVIQVESGGRTMLGENQPITSSMGAMGLMQLMPSTYQDMRVEFGLGADPYDPHDNILAGAAYLRWLRARYGYPEMFAAYNDGPGNLEVRLVRGGLLPIETRNYLSSISNSLAGRRGGHGNLVKFTRPNGLPVMIDGGAVIAVRAALPDEYAPGVQSVITIGRTKQGVRESVATTKSIIRFHGGGV